MNRSSIFKNFLHLPLNEITPANKKEDISGNRITDANILSDVFVNFYVRYANNVHWFLVKEEKKSKDLHHSCI